MSNYHSQRKVWVAVEHYVTDLKMLEEFESDLWDPRQVGQALLDELKAAGVGESDRHTLRSLARQLADAEMEAQQTAEPALRGQLAARALNARQDLQMLVRETLDAAA